jgi:hypothetical protein
MPNVDIPGVGVVAFPDSMSDDAIAMASKRLYSGAGQVQAQQTPILPSDTRPNMPVGEMAAGAGALGAAGFAASRLPGLAGEVGAQASPIPGGMPPNVAAPIDPRVQALGRFAVKQLPGARLPTDLLELAKGLQTPAPAEASGAGASLPPTAAAPAAVAKPNTALHTLTEEDVKLPEFKRFSPGYQMRRATYENALMEQAQPGAAATRTQGKIAGKIGPRGAATSPPLGELYKTTSDQNPGQPLSYDLLSKDPSTGKYRVTTFDHQGKIQQHEVFDTAQAARKYATQRSAGFSSAKTNPEELDVLARTAPVRGEAQIGSAESRVSQPVPAKSRMSVVEGTESPLETQMRASIENAPAWKSASYATRQAALEGLRAQGVLPPVAPARLGNVFKGGTLEASPANELPGVFKSGGAGAAGTAAALLPIFMDKQMEDQFWKIVDPNNAGPRTLDWLKKVVASHTNKTR